MTPEDQDRFVITASEAARACKQAQDSIEWGRQWNDFLVFMNQWCKSRADKVDAGYVTIGDSALNVLICVTAGDYDFDMEDEIAELDLEISKKFPLCCALRR